MLGRELGPACDSSLTARQLADGMSSLPLATVASSRLSECSRPREVTYLPAGGRLAGHWSRPPF
jgi:hypothetical protein